MHSGAFFSVIFFWLPNYNRKNHIDPNRTGMVFCWSISGLRKIVLLQILNQFDFFIADKSVDDSLVEFRFDGTDLFGAFEIQRFFDVVSVDAEKGEWYRLDLCYQSIVDCHLSIGFLLRTVLSFEDSGSDCLHEIESGSGILMSSVDDIVIESFGVFHFHIMEENQYLHDFPPVRLEDGVVQVGVKCNSCYT